MSSTHPYKEPAINFWNSASFNILPDLGSGSNSKNFITRFAFLTSNVYFKSMFFKSFKCRLQAFMFFLLSRISRLYTALAYTVTKSWFLFSIQHIRQHIVLLFFFLRCEYLQTAVYRHTKFRSDGINHIEAIPLDCMVLINLCTMRRLYNCRFIFQTFIR